VILSLFLIFKIVIFKVNKEKKTVLMIYELILYSILDFLTIITVLIIFKLIIKLILLNDFLMD